MPLRQTTGLVASLLSLAGLDWTAPDFSTLSRRPSGLNVAIPYRPSTGALHLFIASTGIKSEGEGEWFAKEHKPSKPRRWRKVHLGTEEDQALIWGIKSPTKVDTLEIKAIEVTGSRVGDAPMLPELLNQNPAYQAIGKISADGAYDYDTRGCHGAIAARSACAVIPARKNARPWLEKTPGAEARNEIFRAARRLGAPSGGSGAATTDEA